MLSPQGPRGDTGPEGPAGASVAGESVDVGDSRCPNGGAKFYVGSQTLYTFGRASAPKTRLSPFGFRIAGPARASRAIFLATCRGP